MFLNSTAIGVQWEEPNPPDQNGVITSYTITYSSQRSRKEQITTTETEVVLGGLEEFTLYTIIVNASTTVGTGPGAVTTARTDEDGEYIMTQGTLLTVQGRIQRGVDTCRSSPLFT